MIGAYPWTAWTGESTVSYLILIALIAILALQICSNKRIIRMSEALDRIKQEVAENRTVVDSAITLISGLAQQIRDAIDDPEELNALADQLDAQQADLGAAVTANTSEAPAPEEDQA